MDASPRGDATPYGMAMGGGPGDDQQYIEMDMEGGRGDGMPGVSPPVDPRLQAPQDSRPPLHAASEDGNVRLLKELLAGRNGGPVDGRDRAGRTPLLVACAVGHAAVVVALLRAGAAPTAVDGVRGVVRCWAAAGVGFLRGANRQGPCAGVWTWLAICMCALCNGAGLVVWGRCGH